MDREAIYGGLFAQLSAIPGLATKSRKLEHWEKVLPVRQPALFQAQDDEDAIAEKGLPHKWDLSLSIYVYVHAQDAESTGALLNPILDAVTAIVNKRNPITGKNDLSGIPGVDWARIDGRVKLDEGVLGRQGVAIIPVKIQVID